MPVYPGRTPNTWRVTVYSRGKQHEWIVPGLKKDARAYEDERRRELREGAVATRSEPRFSSFCLEQYSPHAARHLGARTWNTSRRFQVAELVRHFGALRLSEVPTGVESFKTACEARGLKPSSTNHYLVVLRAILSFAKERKLIAEVPKLVKLPKGPERRVRFWTLDDVRRFYSAIQADRWRRGSFLEMVQWLLETGCRREEAIMAEWSWVDWDAGFIRIPVTEAWHPKSKRGRDVPLSSTLADTLRRMGPSTGRIFRTYMGTDYRRFPVKLWARTVEESGVIGTPHITRHTFASHFLAKVPDLQLLAEVLGHSTTRTTEIYAHMLPGRLARARDVVQFAPPGKGWTKASRAAGAASRKPAASAGSGRR